MNENLTEKALDHIIEEMIEVVENSRDEIFEISEEARRNYDEIKAELEDIKVRVVEHIEKADQLEEKVKASRKRLSIVNRDFDKYTEEEIRFVYEKTHEMQMELIVLRKEEKTLRDRRDELERRLLSLGNTVDRSIGLANKISVILSYLYEDFKQVNIALEEAREKHKFVLQIIEAQEEERKRISREIHDGPAQMLANILLRYEIIDRGLKEGKTKEVIEEIRATREMVRFSLRDVRRMIYDLRPMALDDLGLIPTLNKYIDDLSKYTKKNIEFIAIGEPRDLQENYEIVLFRLVQEALQNAIKHANANLIKVKIEIRKDLVTLLIIDDGEGFEPNNTTYNNFGIKGMKERVEMLKGKLEIDTDLGKGTRVRIKVPNEKLETSSIN